MDHNDNSKININEPLRLVIGSDISLLDISVIKRDK